MNLCHSCRLDFGSINAFDAHRVGEHGPGDFNGELEDWTPELGRRCLTIDEMLPGAFVKNAFGRLSLAEDLEAARKVRESKAGSPSAIEAAA
jgi:hypothetical protein